MPFSKGSSTTTAVLLEAVSAGTAPAAILTTGADAFFALASIVADVMYGKSFPVIALESADFASLRTGEHLRHRTRRPGHQTHSDSHQIQLAPPRPSVDLSPQSGCF